MKNPKLISGIIILILLILVALFGPAVAKRALFPDVNPLGRGEFRPFQLPSPEHPEIDRLSRTVVRIVAFYPPHSAPEGEPFVGDDGMIDLAPLVRDLSLLSSGGNE